jgi:MFS family permease
MNGDTTMAAEALPEAEAPGLRAHAALIVLGLVNMFNYMDRTVFSVLLESIKSELLLSDAQMGILGGLAYAAFYAIFGLTVGWMADRYHRIRIISTCLAVWSLASIFCGLARSFLQLFFARLSLGAGEAGCIPSAHSIIGDCFPPQRRALAISVFTGIGLVGTLIGLTVSGVLLERVGWRNVFIIFGLPGLALALLLPLLLKEPERGRFERTGLPIESLPLIQAIRSVFAVRTARRLLTATTLYYCIFGAWVWVPTYYLRAYDISAAQFSTLGGLCLGIGSIVGIIVGGILVNALIGRNRLWEFWFPALTALLTAPLFLLVYLTENIAASYVFLFLGAMAVGLGMGPSLACMHIVTEHRVRATAIALVAFFTSIFGYGLTPVAIGVLSDGFGAYFSVDAATSLRWAMLCPLLLSIAAALMYFVASGSAHQDEVN